MDGRWTRFSKPKETSSLTHDVEVEKLDEKLSDIRNQLEKVAFAKQQGSACLLESVTNANVIYGDHGSGGGSLELNAEVSDNSIIGVEASVLNCQVSKCLRNNGLSTTIVKPRMGHLKLRMDDSTYKLRFLSIPENSHLLEFNNPHNSFTKSTINLLGCRANELDEMNQQRIGKTGVAAKKCMMLNCTREWKLYYFCEPSEGPPAMGYYSIDAWRHDINRAAYPNHRLNRYEAGMKATLAPKLTPFEESETSKKKVDYNIYSHRGYREPFYLSFLTRLVRIDASPHFPQLLGTFRCMDLPKMYRSAPKHAREGNDNGILPPHQLTGEITKTVSKMKIDGDAFSSLYFGMVTEAISTDLQSYLDNLKGFAIDNDWVRGVTFQLIHALGVGFHAYGLHHNDILTMSNIRFKQYPRESKGTRKYWCYQLNDLVLSGDGCGNPTSKVDAPFGGKVPMGGSTPKSGANATMSFLETSLFERSGPPEDDPAGKSPAEIAMLTVKHQCIGGVIDTLPADELPSTVCSAGRKSTPKPNYIAKSKKDPNNPNLDDPSAVESPTNENGSMDPTDPSASDTKTRTSWCIPADEVDGMQVKLHNFGTSVLTKKTIEFWKKGFTFPNLPWNDDLADVAIVLCGYVASHMAVFDVRGRDLCRKMKNGYYQENPLAALRHPYFDEYLTKQQMPLAERNNYVYTPKAGCDCKLKNGKKKNPQVPLNDADKTTGREHPENGIKLDDALPTKIAGQKSSQQYFSAGHMPTRIKLMNLTKTKPDGASPMTPWIIAKQGSGLDVKVLVGWVPYKGSNYYNLLLDGISAYSGPEHKFQLNNLREGRCYRIQVAAFVKTSETDPKAPGKGVGHWTPPSHSLHVNRCGLRSDA